jgi:hypothetical protein
MIALLLIAVALLIVIGAIPLKSIPELLSSALRWGMLLSLVIISLRIFWCCFLSEFLAALPRNAIILILIAVVIFFSFINFIRRRESLGRVFKSRETSKKSRLDL